MFCFVFFAWWSILPHYCVLCHCVSVPLSCFCQFFPCFSYLISTPSTPICFFTKLLLSLSIYRWPFLLLYNNIGLKSTSCDCHFCLFFIFFYFLFTFCTWQFARAIFWSTRAKISNFQIVFIRNLTQKTKQRKMTPKSNRRPPIHAHYYYYYFFYPPQFDY